MNFYLVELTYVSIDIVALKVRYIINGMKIEVNIVRKMGITWLVSKPSILSLTNFLMSAATELTMILESFV